MTDYKLIRFKQNFVKNAEKVNTITSWRLSNLFNDIKQKIETKK